MGARGKALRSTAHPRAAAPIPLADLRVQWTQRKDGKDTVVTVSGDIIARLLAWAECEEMSLTLGEWPGAAGDWLEDLRRVARLVQAASESEETGNEMDVFWFLRRLMHDLLQRAEVASGTAADLLPDAVVTVGAAPAKKAVA